jgi:hypothetical protein
MSFTVQGYISSVLAVLAFAPVIHAQVVTRGGTTTTTTTTRPGNSAGGALDAVVSATEARAASTFLGKVVAKTKGINSTPGRVGNLDIHINAIYTRSTSLGDAVAVALGNLFKEPISQEVLAKNPDANAQRVEFAKLGLEMVAKGAYTEEEVKFDALFQTYDDLFPAIAVKKGVPVVKVLIAAWRATLDQLDQDEKSKNIATTPRRAQVTLARSFANELIAQLGVDKAAAFQIIKNLMTAGICGLPNTSTASATL